MNEERGASLRLLYQIKLAVQKEMGVTNVNMTTTGLRQDKVDKTIKERSMEML
jgi:hypothetical protein